MKDDIKCMCRFRYNFKKFALNSQNSFCALQVFLTAEQDEIGSSRSTHEKRNAYRILVGEPEEKRSL
jgi:hypothetical protein